MCLSLLQWVHDNEVREGFVIRVSFLTTLDNIRRVWAGAVICVQRNIHCTHRITRGFLPLPTLPFCHNPMDLSATAHSTSLYLPTRPFLTLPTGPFCHCTLDLYATSFLAVLPLLTRPFATADCHWASFPFESSPCLSRFSVQP